MTRRLETHARTPYRPPGTSQDVVVRGAREHNLADVELSFPRDALVTFTGVI